MGEALTGEIIEPQGVAEGELPSLPGRLVWGDEAIAIELELDGAPRIAAVRAGVTRLEMPPGLPLVDVLTVGDGHVPASDRLVHTRLGAALRTVHARSSRTGDGAEELVITAAADDLEVVVELRRVPGVAVLQARTTVRNRSRSGSVALRAVTSFSTYLGASDSGPLGPDAWDLLRADSDWLAEGRWTRTALRTTRLPRLREELTGHDPRGEHRTISTGTWSTGRHLPVGLAVSARHGAAWAWQVEHNGAWRWEVGEDTADAYVALSGPTDEDHHWLEVLEPGETFESVPVAVALAADEEHAVRALTAHRRRARRPHVDNAAMPVVFNDYMNTLNGDPTTARLLPLIAAAAEVGAEVFCIDAGWYADGDWWDSVGEWQPSTARFPRGLGEVIAAIHDAGMVPGLWLEPEVVGVRSPIADRLPHEAFLQRRGQRIAEHDRFLLDLRHPAARAHLDEVVDRLVARFGIGFFKLDYNVDPGPGTDLDADSPGAGLLAHNRAHLAWLDGVLDRHPELVLENCGSGAMRADPAMLARLQMQSTSDQQDFLLLPPIAAAAPMSMVPEQAANWAYPQPDMPLETVAFCLVTGMLGRFYLSGYLNRMDLARRELVRDGVAAAKSLRCEIASGSPFWPLGLPGWDDPVVALGLRGRDADLIAVWDRAGQGSVLLDLGHGPAPEVTPVFPTTLATWTVDWDEESGTLRVTNPTRDVGARLFRIERRRTGA